MAYNGAKDYASFWPNFGYAGLLLCRYRYMKKSGEETLAILGSQNPRLTSAEVWPNL